MSTKATAKEKKTKKVIKYTIVTEIEIDAKRPEDLEFISEVVDKCREFGSSEIRDVEIIEVEI